MLNQATTKGVLLFSCFGCDGSFPPAPIIPVSDNRSLFTAHSLTGSQLFLELLNLGLYLLPEGLLRRLLASVDQDRNHLLDSRDIDAGTLGFTPLAMGDGPVHDLGLEGFLYAYKFSAVQIAEGLISG